MPERRGFLRPALSTAVGVSVAVGLLGFTLFLTPACAVNWTSSVTLASGQNPPRGDASGGPEGPTNATFLHVRFNASDPVQVWVAPGGSEMDGNGTISFTHY
jgi:hypothetical protein